MLDTIRDSDRERFWSKVITRSIGCWEWTGGTAKGYGVLRWRGDRQIPATRIAWELHHGTPPPDDLVVRHTCDNPPCTNPDHLILGTRVDNSDDMFDRGRRTTGDLHEQSKLTAETVGTARIEYRQGSSMRTLADKYGVSYSTMNEALTGKTWARGVSIPPCVARGHEGSRGWTAS